MPRHDGTTRRLSKGQRRRRRAIAIRIAANGKTMSAKRREEPEER